MSTILQEAINEMVYRVRFSSSTKGKNYFVYGPTAQRTEDKNELWTIIKNDNEVYGRLISDTGLVESELERRVLKLLSNVPSVEDETLAEDAVTGEGQEKFKTTGTCDKKGDEKEINKQLADESKSRKKDGDPFKCSDCDKVFSKKKLMQAHKLQEHQDSEFICVTCKKKFKSEYWLLGHLEFGEFCSHLCQWCLKTFTRKNDLEKHQKICQSVGQLGGSCSICSKSFELQFDLEWHRKKMTNIDGSYKYVCAICEQIFCDLSTKLDHVHGKHKEGEGAKKIVKLFPCENCGLNLQSKNDLLNHLETHSDRKSRTKRATEKHECDLCHSKFTVKKSLDRHILGMYDKHGSSKYRCEECNIVFCTGKQLEKHKKQTHSDLTCQSCSLRFTTKRALDYHIERQETFNCSVCGKQFCNKKTFTAHMNRHYKEIPTSN